MMLTPEQRPTLTISESGVVLTETYDGNEVPAEYSFSIVNDYVHAHGRHFEELQYLALGMVNHIDAQQSRISELEAQYAIMLSLLADIRIACGDNGKRMQDELVAYIRDLEQDAARYRWLKKYDKDNQCCFVSNIQYKEYDQEIDEAMQK